ncbi:MAG: bi-domain-containing oxidoreductase [Candidatus Hydrogenedentes bacterium]|nr:bi-domain-containing oxidoreductase [Candidatus Hydrogenedentota bacterium]
MKQVLVKGGKVHVEEVPPPCLVENGALVQIHYSLISSGTESGFVSSGGTASFVAKKARDPLNVEKLKRKIASVGIRQTIDLVKSKLFEFQAPGYSAAGVIVECGPKLHGYRVGDRVACAGVGYASHAEYDVVPQNLLTPIPDGVELDEAAFVTLGAIGMQGVRQLFPTFGETFIVMGLGLLGQLTLQILRAAGCRVICSDPIQAKRDLAASLGAEAVCAPGELSSITDEFTGGYGADGVLICAASKGSEVTNSALDLCRQKGRVSVVGAVGMQLARESMYMKELDFRLSCSYGPGRYNPEYEEKGLDYPIGYVRWTEGRNMAEFLRMIAEGKVKVRPLVSVTKDVGDADDAYKTILDPESGAVSALLKYPTPQAESPAVTRKFTLKTASSKQSDLRIAVIGAGGFANAFHLPNLQRMSGVRVAAVCSATGAKAKQAGEKVGADYCTTDYREILADSSIDGVVIATRHNLHKSMALDAIDAGKHVFVEKPLALTVDDAKEVCAAVERTGLLLSVGFNRRFSKFSLLAKKAMGQMHGPKMLLYRCNAGQLPPGHWTMDPEVGGGRILGECVHFFDLCCWFAEQDPVDIRADRIDADSRSVNAPDNVTALLRFGDGSLATIVYCALGHPAIPKEHIEIFGSGKGIVIEDFRSVRFAGFSQKDIKQSGEHKGQFELLENWVQAIQGKAQLEVTAAHGLRATEIACAVSRQCIQPNAIPDGPSDSPV